MISVRDLSIQANPSTSSWARWTSNVRQDKALQPGRPILSSISLDVRPGTLTAIVGGSGSGKTTLLETIARRLSQKGLQFSGAISYSGRKIELGTGSTADLDIAYVVQADRLIPQLTVRETLTYAADLRLPKSWSKKQRCQAVEDVIDKLDLATCAETRIGDNLYKGCSGGEKRRTSIGIQLLTNHSILVLDEPTTGLDATASLQVMKLLRKIAREGKTVLVTIHQPRADIWNLIDSLIVLAKGSVVYEGLISSSLPYFSSLGYSKKAFVNPFEFIIDTVAVDTRSPKLEHVSATRVDGLIRDWQLRSLRRPPLSEKSHTNEAPQSKLTRKSGSHISLLQQIVVLTRRTWLVTCRDPLGLLASIIEAVAMGIIGGLIFWNIGSDLSGIRSREGAMWSAAVLQSYLLIIFETYRLTEDIKVFDRERREGVVSAFTFVASRRLARATLEDIPVPFLYSVIFYFRAGFRIDGAQYLRFFSIIFMLQLVAVNLATFCVALIREFTSASLIANVLYTLQSFPGGYALNIRNIGVWFRWMKWTSAIYYGFGALCTNEFAGQFYDCPLPGGPSNPACAGYTGSFILDSLSLPENWLWKFMTILAGYVSATFFAAVLALHLVHIDISVSRQVTSDLSFAADEDNDTSLTKHWRAPATVKVEDCSLSLQTRSLGRKKQRKSILSSITSTFEPGTINAIIGASGSGKTSLLNLLANRLPERSGVHWDTTGTVLLNDSFVEKSVIDSICAYVPQTDEGMLPYLTIRETLHFAAQMRLPQWMKTSEKIQRAEDLILQLGLKDCADSLIGSEHSKGISGGEKRRVSIAIQILTEPIILLLDEPTSGLDAFTATSIIDVLQRLADEGRTIIMTIHQPRTELFNRFGNVLLLAKGGLLTYSGRASEMLLYLQAINLHCPENHNPADFALDSTQSDNTTATDTPRRILVKPFDPTITTISDRRTISQPAELGSYVRRALPIHSAVRLLVKRGFINIARQPKLATARPSQILGLGIVAAAFFAPLRHDYYAVQSRVGYLLQFCSLYFVGMLNAIGIYPAERDLLYREDDDRLYPLEAFFLYYLALEVPAEIIGSLIFAVLVVMVAGLPRTVELVFQTAFNAFCVVSCGESMGIIFMTVCSHTGLAVSLSCIVLSLSLHLAGVLSLNFLGFLQVINHVSPIKWFTGNMAVYSLTGVKFTCDATQRLADGQCPIETGEQVLQLFNLDVDAKAYICALAGVTVGYRLMAYFVLRVRRRGLRFIPLAK